MERKYKRCPECGLDIRCGDVEKHNTGWHHKHRIETLKSSAILSSRSGQSTKTGIQNDDLS